MPQCHGYFPLTCPHFLLLAAFWSQGSIRSSGWARVDHTEFSAMFAQRGRFKGISGFIPVQRRHRVVPEMGQGTWCQAQQAPRAATSRDRCYSGTSPARARKQGTQLSAGLGEEHHKQRLSVHLHGWQCTSHSSWKIFIRRKEKQQEIADPTLYVKAKLQTAGEENIFLFLKCLDIFFKFHTMNLGPYPF